MCSSTCTKPRGASTPAAARPSFSVLGTRPVATMQQSTSSVSTGALVSASIISTTTGRSWSAPGRTAAAKTFVRESMPRFVSSRRSATRATSRSKAGMSSGSASITVTSAPSAVYMSANSSPMMPLPMMATYSGTCSSRRASSLVYTVSPSTSIPGGTKGTEPGARMMSCAVSVSPPPTSSTWGSLYTPNLGTRSTPSRWSDPSRPPRTLATSCSACAATPARSKATFPTVMPMAARCSASPMSRTRPDAASSALLGTQPRFTHVPPTSPPDSTQVLRPIARAWSAAPCPPTPHPTMMTS
mmetsp:Transcript_3581/g.10554  ORF Transcript_3581/g.10554 Transcript_3581/m.10554 type:complete len:300 (-) Transcript_3581:228-1127(-)